MGSRPPVDDGISGSSGDGEEDAGPGSNIMELLSEEDFSDRYDFSGWPSQSGNQSIIGDTQIRREAQQFARSIYDGWHALDYVIGGSEVNFPPYSSSPGWTEARRPLDRQGAVTNISWPSTNAVDVEEISQPQVMTSNVPPFTSSLAYRPSEASKRGGNEFNADSISFMDTPVPQKTLSRQSGSAVSASLDLEKEATNVNVGHAPEVFSRSQDNSDFVPWWSSQTRQVPQMNNPWTYYHSSGMSYPQHAFDSEAELPDDDGSWLSSVFSTEEAAQSADLQDVEAAANTLLSNVDGIADLLPSPRTRTEGSNNNSGENALAVCKTSRQCNVCDKSFRRQSALRRHFSSKHEKPGKMFSCPECDYKFSRRDSRNRHAKATHEGKKLVECPHCGGTVPRRSLNLHFRTQACQTRSQSSR